MFSKHWKKIISMVLALALLLQVTPLAVHAEETLPADLECDPQTGMSSLYEYTPFDIWYAGTAYVNTYLGDLHLRRSDLTLGGERMPVTIEFYYDDVNDGIGNPYGFGWSTTYNQFVVYDAQTTRYRYKDENGTWIYFTKAAEANGEEIWCEDVQYGVGEVGIEMYREKGNSPTNYSVIRIVKNGVHYSFDTNGRLVRMSDGANQITITYEDNTYRIAAVTDPVGRQFCFFYTGGYLRQICAKTADDVVVENTTITYTIAAGKLVEVNYGEGYEVAYRYDSTGRMVRASNVDLCGYTFGYTGTSNVVSMAVAKAAMGTDSETSGSVTMIERPADNQVLVTSEGIQQKYVFDNCGRVVNCELLMATSDTTAQATDASSFVCVYGYNLTYGYVTTDDEAVINTVTNMQTYDADGVIDSGNAEEDSTDAANPEDAVTEEYVSNTNEYGNVTSEEHIIGEEKQTTSYTYDSTQNYLRSVTDTNGNTEYYYYDSVTGLISTLVDACGNHTRYTYNALRELESVSVDVSGLKSNSTTSTLVPGELSMDVTYTYSSGRLSTLTYGDIVYQFTYDAWGNVLKVMMGGYTLVSYSYGDYAYKGQVQTLTYGNGQRVFYTYNSLGQVTTVGYTGQLNRFVYTYDSDGTLRTVQDTVLNTTTQYSDQGYAVISGNTNYASNILYSYSSTTDTSYQERVLGNTYNHEVVNEDRVTTKTSTHSVTGNCFTTSTAYDAFNRLYEKVISIGSLNINQEYGYVSTRDSTGTLVSDYSVSYSGSSAQGEFYFHYEYDGNGNITRALVFDPDTGTPSMNEYAYDYAGQLTEVYDRENGYYYTYCYDEHGNLLQMQIYGLEADGTMTPIEQKTMVYSGSILRTVYSTVDATRTYTVDAMGNPTRIGSSEATYTLTWGEGRMLQRISQNAANYVAYTYNVDGLRAAKNVVKAGVSTVTEYVWGINGLAGFSDGTNTVVVLYDNESSPIGFTLNGTRYAYVKNLQGDVLRILDEAGNVVVSYAYDPWGVPTVTGDTDLAALNPCSYRGYDYDEETGLYYLQSRYYDPELGRFLNTDSVAFLGATDSVVSYNLFAYCENNAISGYDPLGYINWWKLGNGIRIVVTGLWSIIRAVAYGWIAAATSSLVGKTVAWLATLALSSAALQQYAAVIVAVSSIITILWQWKSMLYNIPYGISQIIAALNE